MMESNEAGTLSALSSLIKDRIEPLIARHRGRTVPVMRCSGSSKNAMRNSPAA